MPFAESKTTFQRLWALVAAAALLAVAGRGRRARRRRLGAAARRRPRSDLGNAAGLLSRAKPSTTSRSSDCRVEGHVTGFQSIADGVARPFEAPFEGKVVAWSITLSKPSSAETKTTTDEVGFFDDFLGTPSQARIGILRPVEGSKPPKYKLVRQSPLEVLNPYFGSTPVFALDHPLTVLKGQIVALTIPTWAPMFAVNISPENTWRGSRLPEHCISREDIQGGHPQQGVGKTKTYGCYYSEARLLYTATLVKKP